MFYVCGLDSVAFFLYPVHITSFCYIRNKSISYGVNLSMCWQMSKIMFLCSLSHSGARSPSNHLCNPQDVNAPESDHHAEEMT